MIIDNTKKIKKKENEFNPTPPTDRGAVGGDVGSISSSFYPALSLPMSFSSNDF